MITPDRVANVTDADKALIAKVEAIIDEMLMASPFNGINIVVGEALGDLSPPMRVLGFLIEKYREAGWTVNARGFPPSPPKEREGHDARPEMLDRIYIRLPSTGAKSDTESVKAKL